MRALRHGMVGQPGWELFGPWDEGDEIRAAILEAGREFGIRAAGGRTYSSNTLESGWIPSPLPAVYTGERNSSLIGSGCPADAYEAVTSIGGSFVSDRIEDYYLTPADFGYELAREVRPRLHRPRSARGRRRRSAPQEDDAASGTPTTSSARTAAW